MVASSLACPACQQHRLEPHCERTACGWLRCANARCATYVDEHAGRHTHPIEVRACRWCPPGASPEGR